MRDHGGQSLFRVGSEFLLFSPASLGSGRQKRVGGGNEDELRQAGGSH